MAEQLQYDRMVENALRSVVHQALVEIQADGLPGDHHFYITFMTQYPGVQIPDYLRTKYPEEMTIVLQHQFWGLEIKETQFEVGLSFNKIQEYLVIPFAAVSAFADPSVQFGLQFSVEEVEYAPPPTPEDDPAPASPDPSSPSSPGENIVSLDHFRKK